MIEMMWHELSVHRCSALPCTAASSSSCSAAGRRRATHASHTQRDSAYTSSLLQQSWLGCAAACAGGQAFGRAAIGALASMQLSGSKAPLSLTFMLAIAKEVSSGVGSTSEPRE